MQIGKIIKKRSAAALILFVLIAALFAPALLPGPEAYAKAVDPEDPYYGIASELYDIENGLPTSEANAVAQTPDGFIWVGCYSGLYRYDSRGFVKEVSDPGLTAIVNLFVDSKGRLWVGTNDNGAAFTEGEGFTFFDHNDGLLSDTVKDFEEDENGNILIATTEGIAFIDRENTLHRLEDPRIDTEYIQELRREGGDIYGTTIDGEFFSIRDLSIRAFHTDTEYDFEANCIYPDPDDPDLVYIGTRGSEVLHVDFEHGMKILQRSDVAPLSAVNAILKTEKAVFLATGSGIGYLDREGVSHIPAGIPMNSSVYHVFEDKEGNLWFTSTRQGLLKLMGDPYIDIAKKASLEGSVVNSMLYSGDVIYIGTDDGLTVLDKDYRKVENDLTAFLAGCRIRSIKKDSKGNKWFSTFSEKGLVISRADGSITNYGASDGVLPTNRVRTSFELSDGCVAVSASGGLTVFKDEKPVEFYDESSGLTNIELLTVSEASNGDLLAGSDGGGMYRIPRGGKAEVIDRDDGLTSEVILRLKRDEKKKLHWIISSNSLGYYEDETGKVTILDHFPYSNNFDIFPDGKGRYWILASDGIYVVPEEDLISNAEDMRYAFYDLKNGMPAITTANSRNFLNEDGMLYISGSTGPFAINIRKAADERGKPLIAIPSVTVNGEEKYLGAQSDVVIPSDTKRLIIDAYALTYGLDDPEVSYRLEGFDDDTAYTGSMSDLEAISYTNLDGGDYYFTFSVLDPMTKATVDTGRLHIEKRKSIFEQEGFWIAVAALAGGVIFYLARLADKKKTEALMKEAKEKRELINQIVSAFAKCIDSKDRYTNGHSFRVAQYTKMIAEKMDRFTEDEIQDYYNIGLLHDIGKISIPDMVLNKPEALNDEEFEIMKSHAERGFDILSEIRIMPDLALGAGYHHEYLDGKGYPKGLKGMDEIPLVAQIIAVADAFDAMNTDRVYRKALPKSVILSELKKDRGTRLNAEATDAFLELIEEGKIGFLNKSED
ncbi:MAG: HD domain-containing protein [Lachnospiraceae bacterium]|nr:HD domain-containing protein [Lachnospiraceae bacterium]